MIQQHQIFHTKSSQYVQWYNNSKCSIQNFLNILKDATTAYKTFWIYWTLQQQQMFYTKCTECIKQYNNSKCSIKKLSECIERYSNRKCSTQNLWMYWTIQQQQIFHTKPTVCWTSWWKAIILLLKGTSPWLIGLFIKATGSVESLSKLI